MLTLPPLQAHSLLSFTEDLFPLTDSNCAATSMQHDLCPHLTKMNAAKDTRDLLVAKSGTVHVAFLVVLLAVLTTCRLKYFLVLVAGIPLGFSPWMSAPSPSILLQLFLKIAICLEVLPYAVVF